MGKRFVFVVVSFLFASFVCSGEEGRPEGSLFPVTETFADADADTAWIAPPPEEKPVLSPDLKLDASAAMKRQKILRYGGIAGIVSGVLLSAGGFGTVYAAASDDPDAQKAHAGLIMIVTGSLITAISSVVLGAATSTE